MTERPYYFTLQGHFAIPCNDTEEWLRVFGSMDRNVRKTQVGPFDISTVFLGIDHNHFARDGADPILFETMIFGGDDAEVDYQTRCSTWDEAEQMHVAAEVVAAGLVARVKAAMSAAFPAVTDLPRETP